jgi:hypothetical protein
MVLFFYVSQEIFHNNVLILSGSLFFNPMNCKIYDYVNGVRDMRKNKVTVTELHLYLSIGSSVS